MKTFEGAKHDSGKLKYSHVPPEVIDAIAVIREYGNRKYSDPDNWRAIAPERWHEALLRHTREIWNDPCHVDEESGLPSLWHLATNAAFLCACLGPELEKSIEKKVKNNENAL